MYNQYAGCNQSVTNEIISFDQYIGYPDPTATYHYRIEPLYITLTQIKSALVCFLLDGFPVLGALGSGKTLVYADLDTLSWLYQRND